MPTDTAVPEQTFYLAICPACKMVAYLGRETGELRRIVKWGVVGELHECPSPRPSSPEGV